MPVMLNRFAVVLLIAGALSAAAARPAEAQQTMNLLVGRVMLPSEGRAPADILLIEHADLEFEISDFNGPTLGGEWLVPLGDRLEAGASVSFWRHTVNAVHARIVDTDGSDLPRTMTLRQTPAAITVRYLPLSQSYRVQPYAGGGLVITNWSFTESGNFIEPPRRIFRDEKFSAIGNALGPIFVFGMRLVGDSVAYGIEGRYHRSRGAFGPIFAHVQAPDIDLGGWTLQATAGLRFGE